MSWDLFLRYKGIFVLIVILINIKHKRVKFKIENINIYHIYLDFMAKIL